MNRRGFLGALLGAAVLDPERLLWVPGRQLISIPAPRVAVARFITIERLERELYAIMKRSFEASSHAKP